MNALCLVFIISLALFLGTLALTSKNVAPKSKTLRQIYENKKSSGKLSVFGEAVFKALLGTPAKASATPSAYGIYKVFSPLSSASNQCASPTVYGTSFGLNICYSYLDYDTNQTYSNIFKYNSTFGTLREYNTSDCTGSPMVNSLPLNTCQENDFKLLPSSSSPVVSTKPGAAFTVYSTKSNCQGNTGKGVQGMTWESTTTNNCFTYDTIAMMGNSSSWTCVSSSITYLEYNTSSSCYGQVSYGQTFPIADVACQSNMEGGFATGWVIQGCN